jgi:uncharacterized phiE125 gp8 family phage protein
MLQIITPPAEEPLGLDEKILLPAARIKAETILRRALIAQTWEKYLDQFPYWTWPIPLPPLQSVTYIRYVDDNGVQQTLSPSLYVVDGISSPARITPSFGNTWPISLAINNSVWIRFSCGYANAAAVPTPIKQWMLMHLASLYEQREQMSLGGAIRVMSLPHAFADGLLDPYRITEFA